MAELQRRNSSIYTLNLKEEDEDFLRKKFKLSHKQLTIGLTIGVCLSITTIILHTIAFFTPHWKEISPLTHSLYVDGVDALIRTEILVYFDSVHRFTRHSYGLFHRCEYLSNNSSKSNYEKQDVFHNSLNKAYKICSKNFLPSYLDEQFNQCHSLQYYRFCTKTSAKNFDINNHYLRPTFDISTNLHQNLDSISSCGCQYPRYVRICHFFGIIALVTLIITAILFAIFPFIKEQHQRVKVKCFAVLLSIFSAIFLIINLSIILNHLEYESIEYLTSIERHYSLTQIYKLSQDTKTVINRFLSSIEIKIGYSTILACIAFALSIINTFLIVFTCKTNRHSHHHHHHHQDDTTEVPVFTAVDSDSSEQNENIQKEQNPTVTTRLTSSQTTTDLLPPRSPPPPPPPPPLTFLPPTVVTSENKEQSKTYSYPLHSCLKRSATPRIHFEDEV